MTVIRVTPSPQNGEKRPRRAETGMDESGILDLLDQSKPEEDEERGTQPPPSDYQNECLPGAYCY